MVFFYNNKEKVTKFIVLKKKKLLSKYRKKLLPGIDFKIRAIGFCY